MLPVEDLTIEDYAVKYTGGLVPKPYYRVTNKTLAMAEALGLSRDRKKETIKFLDSLVHHSVPVEHEKGNRYYSGYILSVWNGVIHGIYTHDGREQVGCPECEGRCRAKDKKELCYTCNNQGIIII